MIVSFVDKPLGRCVGEIGQYHVKYELDIDWLRAAVKNLTDDDAAMAAASRTTRTVTRTVIVDDVNECTYDGKYNRFRHRCSKYATCHNVIGTYSCRCPDGYEGDGRQDGVGCIDVHPPTIACSGAGCYPKLFRAADIHGLVSEDRQYVDVNRSDLSWINQRIQKIFDDSQVSGKDLFCETAVIGKPCFVAFDHVILENGTKHKVDLTPNITVLKLDLPSRMEFASGRFEVNSTTIRFGVTYKVVDASNNVAFLQREVSVTALSNDMFARLGRESIELVLTKMLWSSFMVALLLLLWLFRDSFYWFCTVFPFTLVYLVLPLTLFFKLVDRKHFVAAIDLWLFVSRLGMLDEHQRLTIAFQQWSNAQSLVFQ